ncbi:hypothetical protein NDU88_007774 [Pleurodeles waltl]|uniref:BED-type domain-containing protein n=1 Tax=Pleurodeles waltl TaxID=8319 RepID=A0AAV7NX84_PLEWA|nr:hypothetical protein NDU88_007774 [Pleurodeles waltl]
MPLRTSCDYKKHNVIEKKMAAASPPTDDIPSSHFEEKEPPRKKKDTIVWTFFTILEGEKVNARKVTCSLCNKGLSRALR